MATVAQVVKASLQRILVQASEADLEPDEYQDAMFALNNLMVSLDAQGVALGYTEVSSLSDEITVPTGALRGIIANLAIEVSPDYNGSVTQGLVLAASEGLKAMRALGRNIIPSSYPGTMPVGSGNYDYLNSNRFYDCDEDLILAETTGSISLEEST